MRDALRSHWCATPIGDSVARVRDACQLRGCAMPAGLADARRPLQCCVAVGAPVAPFRGLVHEAPHGDDRLCPTSPSKRRAAR
jgi:hypothetical protein